MTSLAALNTLAIPAEADEVQLLHSVAELQGFLDKLRAVGRTPIILGGGSNVILADRIDAPVCVMRMRGIRARTVVGGAVEVTVAAGENWHDLVRWSLGQGLSGLENLALIPGSVGAAPVQNIGAYGVELASGFVAADVLALDTGRTLRITKDDAEFGYRTSLFKVNPGRFVITAVTMRLQSETPAIHMDYADVAEELERLGRVSATRPVDVAEAVVRIRRRKLPDPRRVPNAGSFFKNPVVSVETFNDLQTRHGGLKSYADPAGIKLAAAQLIEYCINGDDGRPYWAQPDQPVRVWHRQPLVLTNPGRRSGAEVLKVAGAIRGAVEGRFGIRLQLEPDASSDLSATTSE